MTPSSFPGEYHASKSSGVSECHGDQRAKLHGFDALIGMNIIAQGDFAVSNYKGITVFSFRMPSLACLDFVKDIGRVNTPWEAGSLSTAAGISTARIPPLPPLVSERNP